MKIYIVTTLVENTYSGSSVYCEPFLAEEDMNKYYESEIEYMKNEYNISENDIKEFNPTKILHDGILKKTQMQREGISIDITAEMCEKYAAAENKEIKE